MARKDVINTDGSVNWDGIGSLPDKIGLLSDLQTTEKTDLVKAINENTVQLAEIGSLKANATNISRDSFFNGDAGAGANVGWSDRQIALIGDSHGWGEGSPNYQGISSGYSSHVAWIHNSGFFGRLQKYLMAKFDSEPWRVIPLDNKVNPIVDGIGTPVALAAPDIPAFIDRDRFTKSPRIVKGKYYIVKTPKSTYNATPTAQNAMNIMCNAEAREDSYATSEYKYNTNIGLFGASALVFSPDGAGKSNICFEMETPSRYAIIQLRSGYNAYAKAKIELLDPTCFKNDGTFDYEQEITGFGHPDYGTATPSVYVFSENTPSASLVAPPNVTINATNIEIDTAYPGMNIESVYVIDFKQKKKGIIRLSHGGNSVNTTGTNPTLNSSIIISRGIIFGNRDLVRNWSLGGHTVGAWLGEEGNWNNAETRDHIGDLLSYMTGSIKGAVIEAPLVNERIKQTPIATFKTRLTTLKTRLNTGNIIIFTTLGEKSYEFQGSTATINYNDYVNAVREWSIAQGGDVTFVDCRNYIKGLVTSGIIPDYNDLYINDGHPSPMVNELIYEMLKKVVNMKF